MRFPGGGFTPWGIAWSRWVVWPLESIIPVRCYSSVEHYSFSYEEELTTGGELQITTGGHAIFVIVTGNYWEVRHRNGGFPIQQSLEFNGKLTYRLLGGYMPIFEYECCDCSQYFEQLVLTSDEAVSCPKCQSSEVHKKMSVCGFKSGGDKGTASSRVGSTAASGCSGCAGGSCSTCH